MTTFDKVYIGVLMVCLLIKTVETVARFLRRGNKQGISEGGWISWGSVFLLTLVILHDHHLIFPNVPPAIILSVVVGWGAVVGWDWLKRSEKTRQEEIASGRVPKIYNDWAKPDKP